VSVGGGKRKTGGNAGESKLENSGVSRKLKPKTSSKSQFSSLNLAKMVENGQVCFGSQNVFRAWAGGARKTINNSPLPFSENFSGKRRPSEARRRP